MSDTKRIINIINNSKSFLIASHENPDCDAIGSVLALNYALRNLGKNTYCYNRSGVPQHLRFLPGYEIIKNYLEKKDNYFDAVFILDSADMSRVGNEIEDLVRDSQLKNYVIIDHHKTNTIKFGCTYIDVNAASTGVLIYRLLSDLKVEINQDIAKCLYTTLVGDTGSFQYSNSNAEAFSVASNLVKHGADPEEISTELFESESENKIRLLSLILETLELHNNNTIATLYATKKMYRETHTGREDTEGVVNFARSIKGVKVAMLFKEESDGHNELWKVSIRSKSDTDVTRVAQQFGGGGHQKAAGFVVNGNIEQAKKQVLSKLSGDL